MTDAVRVLFIIPLVSFLLLGLFGQKYLKGMAGWIGTLSLLISAGLSLYTAYSYFFVFGKVDGVYQSITILKHAWLEFSPE